MKRVISQLKDKEFEEHLDEMQLALFTEEKLNENEKEEVFKHLSQCKRCREVLKVASEIKIEAQKNKRMQPINNIDYKRTLKRFGSLAAIFIVFISVPKIDTQFDTPAFKGFMDEKGIIDESIEYWEKLFDRFFGGEK